MRIIISLVIDCKFCSCNTKSSETYFTEATRLEEQDKLPGAIRLLDKSIERDSNYLPAYINRAVDKAMLGNYKAAIQDYDIVIGKDPRTPWHF